MTNIKEEIIETESEKEIQCEMCEDTQVVIVNANCCGGCDQCGSQEEMEIPCPDCMGIGEEETESLQD